MTLILNILGGPGCGKSSTAAAVFAELKREHINIELATEYARDKFWESGGKDLPTFPIYHFAKQHLRIARVVEKVDVVVTDSPLLLSLLHSGDSAEFEALVLAEHHRWPSLNIVVERSFFWVSVPNSLGSIAQPSHSYRLEGRSQTEEQSRALDVAVEDLLRHHAIDYQRLPLNGTTVKQVCRQVRRRLAL